jgi:hypothetical protein
VHCWCWQCWWLWRWCCCGISRQTVDRTAA